MKRILIFFLLSSFMIVSCNSSSQSPSNSSTKYIENKGSDTIVNLALAWAERYQNEHADVRISVTGGGSARALPRSSTTPWTLLTLCTLLAVTSASAQYQAEIQASDTLRMRQLAVDLRASMGADRFPDLVVSLHKLVEWLSHSTDPAVRKAVASGELQYQRFAAWRASFLTNYAEAIQHADTADLLLGDRQDAEAVIIGNSSRRARMTVYSGIRDTLKWRSLHQEHMSSLEGTTDTLALWKAMGSPTIWGTSRK